MSYTWCGRDGRCYAFNVLDVFTRQWLGFAFDTRATRHAAIMSITNAVAARSPDPGKLTIRVDNGSQYTSQDFRRSVDVLGARLEYIYVNTPQQNGHIESFHKTLKKEYVWSHEFKDAKVAEVVLLETLDDYNRHRITLRHRVRDTRRVCETLGEGQSAGSGKQIMRTKSVQKMLQKPILKTGVHSSFHIPRLSHLATLLPGGAPVCNLMMPLNGGGLHETRYFGEDPEGHLGLLRHTGVVSCVPTWRIAWGGRRVSSMPALRT